MTLNTIISRLPSSVIEDYQMFDLRTFGLRAIGNLSGLAYTEKVAWLKLTNGKATLPDDFKKIMGVFWQLNHPTEMELKSVNCETEEQLQVETCKIDVYAKIFLESKMFRECYIPLKYVGDTSLLCKMCPNLNKCTEQFTIKNGTIYSSINDGYLCFHYLGIVCEGGDVVLEDDEKIADYIYKYILKCVFEDRAVRKEEGAYNMYQNYTRETEIAFKRARGGIMLRNIDIDNIMTIAYGPYFNLLNYE